MAHWPGLAVHRAEHALIAAKAAALAPFGLTVTEYASLRFLLDNPDASASEVAHHCLLTRQAISIVFGNLEQGGLIERRRHPERRAWHEVLLTDAGRGLTEAAGNAVRAVEARFVAGLSDRDIDRLQRALQRCADNVAPQRDTPRSGQVRSEASSIVSA